MFRFGPWVFSAVQRTNRISGTEGLVIRRKLQEWANVRQFAARSAIYALAFASFGDGQYCREGSFCFGKPGILNISHNGTFQTIVSKQLLLQIYVNSAKIPDVNLTPHRK
jgi:hypothetical protein